MPEQIRDNISDSIEPALARPVPETPAAADEGGRCRPLSEFLYSAENDASPNAAPILAIRVDSQQISGRQIKPLRTPCERIDYPFYDDDEDAAADVPGEIEEITAEEQEPLVQEAAVQEPAAQEPAVRVEETRREQADTPPKKEQAPEKPSEPIPGAPFPLEDPAGSDVPILYRRFLDLRRRRARAQSPSPPTQARSFENLEQVQELMSILPSETREALRDFLHSLRVE
ncbi:MAG: hypothetical protein J6S75_03680 [Thermoguttaceae bacterium]|nr:hypothetical protein [Thermoguttaceae bacterium]